MTRLAGLPTQYGEQWEFEVGSYSPSEVQEFCVRDVSWQAVRLSMKGINTNMKLAVLRNYRKKMIEANNGVMSKRLQVQIDNYLNALKRGGQLDDNYCVRK